MIFPYILHFSILYIFSNTFISLFSWSFICFMYTEKERIKSAYFLHHEELKKKDQRRKEKEKSKSASFGLGAMF